MQGAKKLEKRNKGGRKQNGWPEKRLEWRGSRDDGMTKGQWSGWRDERELMSWG